jgi:hypothetical protein
MKTYVVEVANGPLREVDIRKPVRTRRDHRRVLDVGIKWESLSPSFR